jgi:hypothetical protein
MSLPSPAYNPYRGLVIPRSLFDQLLPALPRGLRLAYDAQCETSLPPWNQPGDGLLSIEGDEVVVRTLFPQTVIGIFERLGVAAPPVAFACHDLPPSRSAAPERFLNASVFSLPAADYRSGEFIVDSVDEQIELVLEVVARWENLTCVVAETTELQERVADAITRRLNSEFRLFRTPILRGVDPAVTQLPAVASTHAFLMPDLQLVPVVVVLAGPHGLTRQIRRCLARLHHARLFLVRLAESLGRTDDDEYVYLTVGGRLNEPYLPPSAKTYRIVRCSSARCSDGALEREPKPVRIWRNDARNAAVVRLARWLQRQVSLPGGPSGAPQVGILVESDDHAQNVNCLLAATTRADLIRVVRLSELRASNPDQQTLTHLVNAIGGPPSVVLERYLHRRVLRHCFVAVIDCETPADARFTRARVASYRRAGLISESRARSISQS